MNHRTEQIANRIVLVTVLFLAIPLGLRAASHHGDPVFTSTATSGPGQSYIFGQADFPAGKRPVAVATADLNDDGKLDLAVVNKLDNTVSILLGKPDGTFQAQVAYATGSAPSSVTVGDFNGDGKLDLAISNQTGITVSILLGNGDGTFQSHVDYAIGGGVGADAVSNIGVVSGDFNGDGRLDLAVSGGIGVSILLGNGDGTFQTHVDYATGIQPSAVVAADFNGDGKLDLAVANACGDPGCEYYPGSVSILLGNGDGTFQAHVDYPTSGPFSLAIGDLNGDGKLDLVAADWTCFSEAGCGGGDIEILLGNGDGTFQPATAIHFLPYGLGPQSVITRDFNGDGKLDLAVTGFTCLELCNHSGVAVALGNGDGTFQAPIYYGSGDPVISSSGLAAGDFNGDGSLDLAFAGPGVSILLGNGDGTFPPNRVDSPAGSGAFSVTTGDFNADGKLDLATANQTGNTASILLGNGDGTFQSHVDYATGSGPSSVAVGDFNGEGKLDLAIANKTANTVSILLGNGDGTFQSHLDYATGSGPASVAVGDFNGDGKLDLAVANYNASTVSILLGNGDGTFQSHLDYATGFGPSVVSTGDFNADGKLDLVLAAGQGFSVMLGTGNGTFPTHVEYAADASQNTPSPLRTAVGDFNGDGKLDLAVGGAGISILLGNGDGTFQSSVDYFAGTPYAVSLTAADFNSDGKLDLAFGGYSGTEDNLLGVVSILPGLGDGTFGAPSEYEFADGSLFAGDFKNDGGVDLGGLGEFTDTVSVLLNTPVIALFPAQLSLGQEPVGTSSAPQTILLSNSGAAQVQIHSIAVAGADPADFTESNNCGAVILPAANCSVSVTFTPTAAATRTAALIISDNALARQQMISLTGTGVAAASFPKVRLAPTSIGFAHQLEGTTSEHRRVTLANTGSGPLDISGIAVDGDFAETNTCGSTVPAGRTCEIKITFTPTTTGVRNGSLTLTDNNNGVAGSTQTVTLRGIGTDFTISATPATQTIPPGHKAIYEIKLKSVSGFSGRVSLRCSGGPPHSACTIFPSSVLLAETRIAKGTVTLFAPRNDDHGTFTLTFTARSDERKHSTSVSLTVEKNPSGHR